LSLPHNFGGRLWLVLSIFLLPAGLSPVAAETPIEGGLSQVIRTAWDHDFAVVQADLLADQAQWTKKGVDRRWFPTVTLGSLSAPPVGFQASEKGGSVSAAPSVTVDQRLPGGGSLSLGYTETLSRSWVHEGTQPADQPWVPSLSLGLTQTLADDTSQKAAELNLVLSELTQYQARRDALITLLQAAMDLDVARLTLVWKTAAESESREVVAETEKWVAQGRIPQSDLWKAQRTLRTASWDKTQAQWSLQGAQDLWHRHAAADLPSVTGKDLAQLTGLENLLPGKKALETWRLTIEQTLAEVAGQAEKDASAPVLKMTVGASKPAATPWTLTGQVGLTLSSDLWVQGSVVEARVAAGTRRFESMIQMAHQERDDRKQLLGRQKEMVAAEARRLDAALARLDETQAALAQLWAIQETTRSEVLAAETERAALALERRRVGWQEVVLFLQRAAEE